ncbi:MAG: hypothetical protein RMK18_09760 [Armatimonadota bacterium]|nr:hypothetical protein [Armatimonadota bacterium]MDW8026129.1 hypothetical protein [Armatimonadota bacterium]
MRLLIMVIVEVLLMAIAVAQRSPIQMKVYPLFGTTVPPGSFLPLKIVVQNNGPSVDGRLVVESSQLQTDYLYIFPVSLPSGSRKEIVATPFVSQTAMSIKVSLRGVGFRVEDLIPVIPDDTAKLIVAVGDEIGGLEWLHKIKSISKGFSTTSWAYCRPEDFPEKTAALIGVSGIILCSGAERLTMTQWKAIRRWVMMGGTLIAPGGSSAIYLRHTALASILPVSNLETKIWDNWQPLGQWLNVSPPSEPSFITVGLPLKDAKTFFTIGKHCLIAARHYGYGSVFFMAFNPWDRAFRAWDGLPSLWLKIIAPHMRSAASVLSGLVCMVTTRREKTFKLDFPPALEITLTLIIYFFVTTVAYSLLRRMGLLDWYWFIAPVIALLFTLIISRSTDVLYKLGNQSIVDGVLIMVPNESDGYLIANTTSFFQRSGLYNMNFGEAESVIGESREEFGGVGLTIIEGRTLTVLMRVPNLSFRSVHFIKPMTLKGAVKIGIEKEGDRAVVAVTNQTPFALKSVEFELRNSQTLYSYMSEIPIASYLAPGQTAKIPLSLIKIPESSAVSPGPIPNLVAEVDNIDIIPTIDVPSIYKSPIELNVVCSPLEY